MEVPITDERKGLPSASGIERISLCPGSWQLERTLPPLPETEDAASGTRIHAALAFDEFVVLSDDEWQVKERCENLLSQVLNQVFGTEEISDPILERRIWAFGGRFSGKADVIVIHQGVGLVIDYKTGRNEVTTADGNLQLRSLAVLTNELHDLVDLTKVVVGIIQPWATEKISLAEYSREDLAKARKWLVGVLDAADKPDAPRIPSEKACRHCRAKAVCPEAQMEASIVPAAVSALTVDGDTNRAVVDMSSKTLGELLNRIPFAEGIFDSIRTEAKRRLIAGEDVPGWQLKPGATREVITDPQAVYERFIEKGGGSATFMPCVEVKKGKLKDALKKVTGIKGKSLDAELEDVLQGCTEDRQNAPSLERVK